ncbi:hypothetical protein predicted by Glimmer/Critica [Bdellovibrio bacteriovorus HD100]|uniref:Uncharacterized protein n=2 Tax=Bdellovibrio bacteriovorus TaxID=959 RepID=Q6MQH2_BDEBA|nr:hypothetical protein predicted by Glimmer/Critica [Bdellovibrio bacteriovorus HD100]
MSGVGFFFSIVVMTFMVLGPTSAYAGKVESIQEVIEKKCRKKISYEEALSLIRPLYLTCVPGTKVTVYDSCQVKCLKPNSGAVIGR